MATPVISYIGTVHSMKLVIFLSLQKSKDLLLSANFVRILAISQHLISIGMVFANLLAHPLMLSLISRIEPCVLLLAEILENSCMPMEHALMSVFSLTYKKSTETKKSVIAHVRNPAFIITGTALAYLHAIFLIKAPRLTI